MNTNIQHFNTQVKKDLNKKVCQNKSKLTKKKNIKKKRFDID